MGNIAQTGRDDIPVYTSLSTSSPTCSVTEDPAFTVITTYQCITSRPIWAFVYTFPFQCTGIEIRDPKRNNRRIGPSSTYMRDEGPDTPDVERTDLVRLEPGGTYETKYIFTVEPKLKGLRHSDVRGLVAGNRYDLTLRVRKWWWMFEDDIGEDWTGDEQIDIVSTQPATEWSPECSATFVATE